MVLRVLWPRSYFPRSNVLRSHVHDHFYTTGFVKLFPANTVNSEWRYAAVNLTIQRGFSHNRLKFFCNVTQNRVLF